MIDKDFGAYARENWTKEAVSELSKDDATQTPLVKSDFQMFAFDKVVKELFGDKQSKSADAFYEGKDILGEDKTKECFYLIEFKRGFSGTDSADEEKPRKKRECSRLKKAGFPGETCPKDELKEKFFRDLERMDAEECPRWREKTGTSRVCPHYSLIKEQRKRRNEELYSSLRLKAMDGYSVLARAFSPFCGDIERRKLIYWVVTDEPSRKALLEIQGKRAKAPTHCQNIENAMERLTKRIPIGDRTDAYLYDDIRAMPAPKFAEYLKIFQAAEADKT